VAHAAAAVAQAVGVVVARVDAAVVVVPGGAVVVVPGAAVAAQVAAVEAVAAGRGAGARGVDQRVAAGAATIAVVGIAMAASSSRT
jgi:hypothetical protein